MDELEARITELGEQEGLFLALRPDLDGNQIMELLGIGPGTGHRFRPWTSSWSCGWTRTRWVRRRRARRLGVPVGRGEPHQ